MASGTWTSVATSGLWSLATNWSGLTVADGSGNTASFTSNITATTTIDTTIVGGWSGTIGNIVFSDNGASNSAWTLGSQSTITLAGGTPTITATTGATISGILAGTAGLIKAGAQTLTLAGANTFSGSISVNAGTLSATTSGSALGADSIRSLTVGSGGALSLNVATTRSSFLTSIAGTGVSSSGAIVIANTGTNNLGVITLTNAATIRSTLTSGTLSSSTIDTTASNYALTLTYGSGSAGTFTVSSLISGGGALNTTCTTNSPIFAIALSNTASTFTGQVSVIGAQVNASVIANAGATSSLGAASGVSATIKLGSGTSVGYLAYVGTTTTTTNRVVDFASTTATVGIAVGSGAGALTFNAPAFTASGSGAKTFSLGVSGAALGPLTITSVIPDSAGGITSLLGVAVPAGTTILSGASTFTGTTTWNGGILSINSIKSVNGGASAIGAPTTPANGTISLGSTSNTATLRYTGSGDTTDRVINLAGNTTGGATIENNGTGPLVFTSAITGVSASSTRTLTLSGSNAGVNDFQGVIANVGSGAGLTAFTKAGVGYWKLTGVNTFSGVNAAVGVSVTGGRLEIPALTALGSGTKTISITSTNRNASMLLNVATTYPSTLSWSLNSGGVDQTNNPLGAIRAIADSTISGAVTIAGTSTVYADTGDLTFNGAISGTSTFFQTRAALGRTVTISGGFGNAATAFGVVGPGTTVWTGSASNTTTTSPNIAGGTLKMVTTTSTVTPPAQFAFTGVTLGGTASQTNQISSRYQYTGGTLELSNSGAAGAVDYTGLTSTSAINLSRGSGKLKLSRDSAQNFTVRLGNTGQPANGYLTIEYGGTNPGTIGTESSIIANSLANGQVRTITYSSSYSALVPVWVDPTSRVFYPALYDGSQNLVAISQASGTTLTLLTQSGSTYNFGFYNLIGDITAQVSARANSIRLGTGTTLPITLAAGAILQTQEIMDMGTGTARTILAGGAGSKLSRNVLGAVQFSVYTNNNVGTGATISADMDARFNAAFTKAGVGILSFTGAVANLSGINIAEGTFRIGSAPATFDSTFGAITLGNVYAASGTTVASEFNQTGDVVVAGLSGGGANTAVTLSASTGDLVLRNSGGATFGGDIVLGGSQKLKIKSLPTNPEGVTQSFQGAFPFTAIEMSRGRIDLDPQYGLTFTGASAPSVTATGSATVNIQAQNPLSADYTINLGALSIVNGTLRVGLQGGTTSGNPYNTRITVSSLTAPTGDATMSLFGQTPNAQSTFTVTGASAGPMGSGVNVWNANGIAYYRTAGQTLSGGGTASVGTVDVPSYGTDTNFSALKTGGTSFTSAGVNDNVAVTGNYTAQNSVTVKSVRTTANITLNASQRLTTDLIIIGGGTPVLSGGEIATQTGNLYLNSNGAANTISSSIVDGAFLTRLIIYANNSPTISGTNSYSGGTVINGGANNPIILNSTSAFGTGPVVGNGGVGCSIGAAVTTFTFGAGNVITLNDGGLRLDASAGKDYVLNGAISGTGDLFLTGAGTFTLGAVGTGTGALRMSSSSIVTVNAAQAFTEYDFNNGSMTFRYGTGYTTDISSFINKRPGNTYRIDTNGQDIAWASVVGNGSTYIKTGTGTHTLGAENYFASATVATGTVSAGNVAALGYGNVTLSAGTTLQSLTAGGQNGKLTITGTLTNSAGGTIRIGG